MKDENFITIQGWMINKLKLSGTELIIYAVVYGFSQDKESVFDGSVKYLEKATGKKRTAIIVNLKSLVEKGMLEKASVSKLGMTFNQYSAIVPPVRKTHPPHTETELPPVRNTHPPHTENTPNNKQYNIVDSIDNNIDGALFKKELILPWESKEFIDKWLMWKSYKKKEKAFHFKSILSEQAALKKLSEISSGKEEKAISIIVQSIENGWSGLFEMKNNSNNGENRQDSIDKAKEYLVSKGYV